MFMEEEKCLRRKEKCCAFRFKEAKYLILHIEPALQNVSSKLYFWTHKSHLPTASHREASRCFAGAKE